MGFLEDAQKMVAFADNHHADVVGIIDSIYRGQRHRAIYLHAVLKERLN